MAHAAERVALLPTEGESFTKPSTTTGAAEVVRAMEDIGELRAVRRDARAPAWGIGRVVALVATACLALVAVVLALNSGSFAGASELALQALGSVDVELEVEPWTTVADVSAAAGEHFGNRQPTNAVNGGVGADDLLCFLFRVFFYGGFRV